jgi:hypothetical protein
MNAVWQDHLSADPVPWLLAADEPWTRYRALVDLLDLDEDHAGVRGARTAMLAHPQVQALAAAAATWGGRPLQRHNDAGHPIYAFSTLADFGVQATDAAALDGLAAGLEAVLAHQSAQGAFQSLVNVSKTFGGTGEDQWAWFLCDAPTLLYALLAMDLRADPRLQQAVDQLLTAVDENGWRCVAAPELGKFRGPGRKNDPCPMANVYALKALSLVPELADSPPARTGAETLLSLWACRGERRPYLFGAGSDYRKLKYPFVWYDLLHVGDVLSRLPFVHADPRFQEMVAAVAVQGDKEGRFTAGSMYRAWQGWSFADKKQPSPWLTLLCCRVLKRVYS